MTSVLRTIGVIWVYATGVGRRTSAGVNVGAEIGANVRKALMRNRAAQGATDPRELVAIAAII